MARIRTIKPDFFLDEGLAEIPHTTRLLFIGLWCLADRDGRLEDRPKYIGAQVFPYEKIPVDDYLAKLNGEWIARYEVGGKKLIQIINFTKHQRVGNREPESILPPCEADLSMLKPTEEEGEGNGSKEGKGKGKGKGKGNAPDGANVIPPPIEDVEKYCAERGGVVNAQKWYSFYTSKGWMVGKNKMKDWKAAIHTWEPDGHKPGESNKPVEAEYDPFRRILGDVK